MEGKLESVTYKNQLTETMAEEELDRLMAEPDNNFLSQIDANRDYIENADTAKEALAFALRKIEERELRTFTLKLSESISTESDGSSYKGVLRSLKEVKTRAREIGSGADAIVVVADIESLEGVSAVCYKFSKKESTSRGRNTVEQEFEIHSQAHRVLSEKNELKIGVPKPFYYSEVAGDKVLVMEKLNAKSVDDLLRGFGSIPKWVTDEHIDIFCLELKKALDHLHENGLYHRDMHNGNIMFTQERSLENVNKIGYIIDFGLSGYGLESLDPYRKEDSSGVFTYADDYGRINEANRQLKELIRRNL